MARGKQIEGYKKSDLIKAQEKRTRRTFTETEKMKIVKTYIQTGSYIETCAKLGIRYSTCRAIVAKDKDLQAKWRKAREKEAQRMFDQINIYSKKFLKFCKVYFDVLADEDNIRKLASKDLEKVTRIFAVNMDKFIALNKMEVNKDFNGDRNINIVIKSKNKPLYDKEELEKENTELDEENVYFEM